VTWILVEKKVKSLTLPSETLTTSSGRFFDSPQGREEPDVSPAELKPSIVEGNFETRNANLVRALLLDPHHEDSHSG